MTFDAGSKDEKDLHELANEAYDPFDEAMTDLPSFFFGKLTVEAYQVVFTSPDDGETWNRPTVYDEAAHGSREEISKRKDAFLSTQVGFIIAPLDVARGFINRDMGVRNRKQPAFQRIVRPSIEALAPTIASIKGLTVGEFNALKEISGMWVGGEFVPRPGNKPEDTWTTIKFTAVFPDRAACEAGEAAARGREAETQAVTPPTPLTKEIKDNADRIAAAAFLPTFWQMAGGDIDKMTQFIIDNDMLNAHFTIDSPEVREVMKGV